MLGRSFLIFLKRFSFPLSLVRRFQSWTMSQAGLMETVTPLISSPSSRTGANCSPTAAKINSLHTSAKTQSPFKILGHFGLTGLPEPVIQPKRMKQIYKKFVHSIPSSDSGNVLIICQLPTNLP